LLGLFELLKPLLGWGERAGGLRQKKAGGRQGKKALRHGWQLSEVVGL
jgi:hypothetical protein